MTTCGGGEHDGLTVDGCGHSGYPEVSESSRLSITELQISFGRGPLFDPLTFDVGPAEIIGLVGPSGVGKTSIFRAIAGLLPSESLEGFVVREDTPSLLFQEERLLPWCDLISNALMPRRLMRTLTDEDASAARAIFKSIGLDAAERSLPKHVSGGMRQRACLARALLQPSTLLLCDEPFNGMDFDVKIKCQRLLLKHVRATTAGCIIVTHDIEDAVALSSRVILLSPPPNSTKVVSLAWKGRPADPVDTRKTAQHFEAVKEILEHYGS